MWMVQAEVTLAGADNKRWVRKRFEHNPTQEDIAQVEEEARIAFVHRTVEQVTFIVDPPLKPPKSPETTLE